MEEMQNENWPQSASEIAKSFSFSFSLEGGACSSYIDRLFSINRTSLRNKDISYLIYPKITHDN